jgi:uncharacterized surface protein with fasciclin (FAS1) repeats
VEELLTPEDTAKLTSILTYHVLPSKVLSKDIAGKTMHVKTVQGADVAVDATNGVIHVIDAVIMPPTAA